MCFCHSTKAETRALSSLLLRTESEITRQCDRISSSEALSCSFLNLAYALVLSSASCRTPMSSLALSLSSTSLLVVHWCRSLVSFLISSIFSSVASLSLTSRSTNLTHSLTITSLTRLSTTLWSSLDESTECLGSYRALDPLKWPTRHTVT